MASGAVTTSYTVEGFGAFPVDMLRYDTSYPVNPEAVGGIEASGNAALETRRVYLGHVHYARGWTPTAARWASFGWRVVEVNGFARGDRRA